MCSMHRQIAGACILRRTTTSSELSLVTLNTTKASTTGRLWRTQGRSMSSRLGSARARNVTRGLLFVIMNLGGLSLASVSCAIIRTPKDLAMAVCSSAKASSESSSTWTKGPSALPLMDTTTVSHLKMKSWNQGRSTQLSRSFTMQDALWWRGNRRLFTSSNDFNSWSKGF